MNDPRQRHSSCTASAARLRPISRPSPKSGRARRWANLLRRYWHPVGLASHATDDAARGARAGRGPDPVPRQDRPAGPGARALRASRHHALLRQGRGARHPLLLSRLAVRRRRPLPRAALRARGRPLPRPRASALVPGAGALRPDLRLHGPAREEAGAAALRMPRSPRRRRVHRTPTTPASAAAATPSRPATGCSISRTCWTPTTSRSCTGISAARSSPKS